MKQSDHFGSHHERLGIKNGAEDLKQRRDRGRQSSEQTHGGPKLSTTKLEDIKAQEEKGNQRGHTDGKGIEPEKGIEKARGKRDDGKLHGRGARRLGGPSDLGEEEVKAMFPVVLRNSYVIDLLPSCPVEGRELDHQEPDEDAAQQDDSEQDSLELG